MLLVSRDQEPIHVIQFCEVAPCPLSEPSFLGELSPAPLDAPATADDVWCDFTTGGLQSSDLHLALLAVIQSYIDLTKSYRSLKTAAVLRPSLINFLTVIVESNAVESLSINSCSVAALPATRLFAWWIKFLRLGSRAASTSTSTKSPSGPYSGPLTNSSRLVGPPALAPRVLVGTRKEELL